VFSGGDEEVYKLRELWYEFIYKPTKATKDLHTPRSGQNYISPESSARCQIVETLV